MRVFVLGAGASVDAGYPTATELGGRLADWAERDGTLGLRHLDVLQKLRHEFGRLEGLENILAKGGDSIPSFATAVSEFFDSIRNQPAELYDRLARERVRRGDVILTFNYDLAVERSLKAAGLWDVADGYGAAMALGPEIAPFSPAKVLKLHGSTNWWGINLEGHTTTGFRARSAQSSLGERPVLFYESDFEFLGYKGVRDPKTPSQSTLVSPLILPIRRKQFFIDTGFVREWEPFFDSLWLEAELALREADEIIVIGFGLSDEDERARDLLLCKANRYASLTVCSQSKSQGIADEFRSHGFKDVCVLPTPTFEAWLNAPEQVAHPYEMSNEEWEREFEDLANSFPQTPVLSDEAISRESLYGPDE